MGQAFDAYHKWLGIPPEDQPPDHYRLLAVKAFESDPDVIQAAADQRMAHLRNYQTGPHSALSQRLLNEVASARCVCSIRPREPPTTSSFGQSYRTIGKRPRRNIAWWQNHRLLPICWVS